MAMGPVAINDGIVLFGRACRVQRSGVRNSSCDKSGSARARADRKWHHGSISLGPERSELKDDRPTNLQIVVASKPSVVPRRLKPIEIKTIADFLSQHSPQKFELVVSGESPEPDIYAADIQKALTDGGWELESRTYASNLQEGITSMAIRPMSTPPNQDVNNPPVEVLFAQAFARSPCSIWAPRIGKHRYRHARDVSLSQ